MPASTAPEKGRPPYNFFLPSFKRPWVVPPGVGKVMLDRLCDSIAGGMWVVWLDVVGARLMAYPASLCTPRGDGVGPKWQGIPAIEGGGFS